MHVEHAISTYLNALRAAHVSPSSSPFSHAPVPTRSFTMEPISRHGMTEGRKYNPGVSSGRVQRAP
jgi:hypothetical protein